MDKIRLKNVLFLVLFVIVLLPFLDTGKVRLGGGFYYYDDGAYFIDYWKRGDSLQFTIPPEVLSYYNNRRILIIKQQPRECDYRMHSRYDYPYGRDSVYYWYIDKRNKEINGPMLYSDMDSFLQNIHLEHKLKKLR